MGFGSSSLSSGWIKAQARPLLGKRGPTHGFFGEVAELGLQKIARDYQSMGIGGFLPAYAYKVIVKFSSYICIKGMTLGSADINVKDDGVSRNYSVGFVDELEFMKWFAGEGMRPDEARNAFREGDECYAFIDTQAGRIASYGWYSHKPTVFAQRFNLHFDDSWVYMYGGFTRPEYRGQRLHALGMAAAAKHYAAAGYRGIISCVEIGNTDSLRSVYRLGYRDFGMVHVVPFFGSSLVFRTRGCKKYGFTVRPRPVENHARLLAYHH